MLHQSNQILNTFESIPISSTWQPDIIWVTSAPSKTHQNHQKSAANPRTQKGSLLKQHPSIQHWPLPSTQKRCLLQRSPSHQFQSPLPPLKSSCYGGQNIQQHQDVEAEGRWNWPDVNGDGVTREDLGGARNSNQHHLSRILGPRHQLAAEADKHAKGQRGCRGERSTGLQFLVWLLEQFLLQDPIWGWNPCPSRRWCISLAPRLYNFITPLHPHIYRSNFGHQPLCQSLQQQEWEEEFCSA